MDSAPLGKKFSSTLTVDSNASGFDQYSSVCELMDWNAERLTAEHVKLMERCNKYKSTDTKRHFDYIADNYEGLYKRAGWPDPEEVANLVKELSKGQNVSELRVLDLGCGTGLVGEYLSKQGFKHIVGLDISPGMLEIASNKGCYETLEEYTIGDPDQFPAQFKNKFDFVVCAGLINNNYLDYKLFEEMTIAMKKGAKAVFAARFSYMGNFWYNETLSEMEGENRWKLLKTKDFFKYNNLVESVGRFAKTPCRAYAY
jgi:predicted TPR repeat methyltransferase